MKIFEIVNQRPVVIPEILLVPEFKTLWERDKSEDKKQANNEFAYIYFTLHFESLYLAYNEDERNEIICQDLFKNKKYIPDAEVKAAMKKFEELLETPATIMVRSARIGMDKIRKFLLDVDMNERTNAGGVVFKSSEVTRAISDLDKVVESYNKLIIKARTEQTNSEKYRGGQTGGLKEFDDD